MWQDHFSRPPGLNNSLQHCGGLTERSGYAVSAKFTMRVRPGRFAIAANPQTARWSADAATLKLSFSCSMKVLTEHLSLFKCYSKLIEINAILADWIELRDLSDRKTI
jgi:hypothetical protein